MPKVSVIIPTYNRATLLNRAINSVINQTYQAFEIIVVDDGSTDDTEYVVASFKDNRINYIKCMKNSGTAAIPRNTGINASRGEYIAQIDDDSEWLPEKLEKQIKAFEGAPSKVGVVYSGHWSIFLNNKKMYFPTSYLDNIKKEGNIHKELLKGTFVHNPNSLIKKECFDKAGMYDESLPAGEEWDLFLRISKFYDFKFIDEPLIINHISSSSISIDNMRVAKSHIYILEKHFQEFKTDGNKCLAGHYYIVGILLCLSNDSSQFSEGRRYLWKAIQIYPKNLKFFLFGFISLFGPSLFHNSSLQKMYCRLKKVEIS